MVVTGGKLNFGRQTRLTASSSTANIMCIVLGSSPELRVERQVSESIKHSTASLRTKINLLHLKTQFEPCSEHYHSRL
jgi:hypothetical protein